MVSRRVAQGPTRDPRALGFDVAALSIEPRKSQRCIATSSTNVATGYRIKQPTTTPPAWSLLFVLFSIMAPTFSIMAPTQPLSVEMPARIFPCGTSIRSAISSRSLICLFSDGHPDHARSFGSGGIQSRERPSASDQTDCRSKGNRLDRRVQVLAKASFASCAISPVDGGPTASDPPFEPNPNMPSVLGHM